MPARALAVWRRRWLIAGLVLAGVAAGLGGSLVMPKVYEARATLVAPREGLDSGLLTGLAAAAAASGMLPSASLTPNRDLLLSVLGSRTTAEAVVGKFSLQKRYGSPHLEHAVERLQTLTAIAASREGIISVAVRDTDPQIAAEIANFYLEYVDGAVLKYGTTRARQQGEYLREQFARAKAALDAEEEALRAFQERNRAIVLPEQTRVAIDASARLKGEIMAAEVQLQVMRSFATDANPDVQTLARRIEEMKGQLGRMQYGERAGAESRDFVVPIARVPELGLELARLSREVKVKETLVNILTQQLEQARMTEARDFPVVQVLDRAVPPHRHVRPVLALNLGVGAAAGLLLGIGLVLLVDLVQELRRAEALAAGSPATGTEG